METIKLNAVFLFELQSKSEWINKVPRILPEKTRGGEQWVWVDKNNNVFQIGTDFEAAEAASSYPCKVYKLVSVSEFQNKS